MARKPRAARFIRSPLPRLRLRLPASLLPGVWAKAVAAAVVGAGGMAAAAAVAERVVRAPVTAAEGAVPAAPLHGRRRAVVVGGGIVGTCTAYYLARAGLAVTVLDAGGCSLEHAASYGNAGTLGIRGSHTLARWEFLNELATDSMRAMFCTLPEFAKRGEMDTFRRFKQQKFVDPHALADPAFWRWSLFYCRSLLDTRAHAFQDKGCKDRAAECRRVLFALAAEEGLQDASGLARAGELRVRLAPGEWIMTAEEEKGEGESGDDARFRKERSIRSPPAGEWPELMRDAVQAGRVVEAEHFSDSAQGESRRFCAALRERVLAMSPGNSFAFRRPVVAVATDRSGRVSGVTDALGEHHGADIVVVCAGAGSAKLLRSAGVAAPVYPLRGYAITASVRSGGEGGCWPAAAAPRPPYCFVAPFSLFATHLTNPPRVRFTNFGELAPLMRTGGASAEEKEGGKEVAGRGNPQLFQRLEAIIRFVWPSADTTLDLEGAERWVGERPLTPDCLPIVGACRVPGLYLNTGHSFDGWRDGAFTSQLVAECVVSGDNSPLRERGVELAYSLERFHWFRSF